MSAAFEDREFALLLAAHANGELTADERERLEALCAEDGSRRVEVDGFERLHAAFADERRLRRGAGRPFTPREAADEGVRRLQQAAARGEELLRGKLHAGRAAPLSAVPPVRRSAAMAPWLAAAALVVAALALILGARRTPPLVESAPGGAVLGTLPRIVLTAEIRAERPMLTWHPVVGASRYDARVEDRDGRVLLQRADRHARSTLWELSRQDFADLRQRSAVDGLFLRVVAFDSVGALLAATGELPLQLVD